MEGMNQFRIKCVYTWKCHNEIPCVAILNKQKCGAFFKNGGWKVKQVLPGGWYEWVGEGARKVCRLPLSLFGGNTILMNEYILRKC
jgi:hypothetical protein